MSHYSFTNAALQKFPIHNGVKSEIVSIPTLGDTLDQRVSTRVS